MVIFTAFGVPQPQGSTKAFIRGGRPVITTDNAKLKPWREVVAYAAQEARGEEWPHGDAVSVVLRFYLPKPKSVRRTYPTTRPDVDKLARGILDALTGVAFKDDSQVVRLDVEKHYDGVPRVEVEIEEV